MSYIPKALIFSRLIIGLLILSLSVLHVDGYKTIAVILFSIGILTDFFDGIIARFLNISTQNLRRLDSTIDQIFFLSVAVATYIECPQFFKDNYIKVIILFGFEGLTYLICFLKFKKEIATHSISSKIWTVFLFATLTQIMLTCDSSALFQICFYLGVITRLEIVGIILVLRNWTNDVPSLYQAILLRQGKPIKRNKIFNG